jgi:Protein of unknown function (DUF2630)
MDEAPVQDRIERLVEEEERLWSAAGSGGLSAGDQRRLERIRDELDSCWDALRRRRAGSPAAADVPDPVNDLEGPDPEPPHLERGSPHEDRPAPDPDEPRDIP